MEIENFKDKLIVRYSILYFLMFLVSMIIAFKEDSFKYVFIHIYFSLISGIFFYYYYLFKVKKFLKKVSNS